MNETVFRDMARLVEESFAERGKILWKLQVSEHLYFVFCISGARTSQAEILDRPSSNTNIKGRKKTPSKKLVSK